MLLRSLPIPAYTQDASRTHPTDLYYLIRIFYRTALLIALCSNRRHEHKMEAAWMCAHRAIVTDGHRTCRLFHEKCSTSSRTKTNGKQRTSSLVHQNMDDIERKGTCQTENIHISRNASFFVSSPKRIPPCFPKKANGRRNRRCMLPPEHIQDQITSTAKHTSAWVRRIRSVLVKRRRTHAQRRSMLLKKTLQARRGRSSRNQAHPLD